MANLADHTWILAIGNEFGEYRRIAELSQITPKRYDWRPAMSPPTNKVVM